MAKVTQHEVSRRDPLRCICGFEAQDELDLNEHVSEMERYRSYED